MGAMQRCSHFTLESLMLNQLVFFVVFYFASPMLLAVLRSSSPVFSFCISDIGWVFYFVLCFNFLFSDFLVFLLSLLVCIYVCMYLYVCCMLAFTIFSSCVGVDYEVCASAGANSCAATNLSAR